MVQTMFDDTFELKSLPRNSKNLPRTKPRIQEPAKDKAENPSPTDAYKKTQISKLCSSKLLSLSQTSLLRKRWAAVLPPGGLQSAAQLGTACEISIPVLPILPPSLLLDSSSQRFLFPHPKSFPSRPGPTPSSAAICGAGASWRLLGRKSCLPRGLQKLIKF